MSMSEFRDPGRRVAGPSLAGDELSGPTTHPRDPEEPAQHPAKRRPSATWVPYALSLPLVVVVAGFFVYPILHMTWTTLIVDGGAPGDGWAAFGRIFSDAFAREIVFRTLRVGLFTTLATFVLAYPLALWMRSLSSRARGILMVLFTSPLLISVIVRTLGWTVFLGPVGLVDGLLDKLGLGPLNFLYTEPAIILGLTQVLLGYMVLTLLTSVLNVPDSVIAAAANLGANWWQMLWHVMLPMTRPSILAGVAIIFPLSVGAYVTPALLGGSRNAVMATQIYNDAVIQLETGRAAAMSIALFLLVLLVVVIIGLLTSSRRVARR